MMYRAITKDENIVIIFTLSFAVAYRIFSDYLHIHFSGKYIIILLMILLGYLLFNRQVKFIIHWRNHRKLYYLAIATITEIKEHSTRYPVFVIEYQNQDNQLCTKELHSFFSIKSIKKNQKIHLMVNRDNPSDIIVKSSDSFLFAFYCIMGVIVELILMIILVNIHE